MRGILGRYRSIRLEQFTLVLFEILFGCLLLSSAIQTVIPILLSGKSIFDRPKGGP